MAWYALASDAMGSQPRIVTNRLPAGRTKTDPKAHYRALVLQSDKHRRAATNFGAEMTAEMVQLRMEVMETAEMRELRLGRK